MDRVEKREQWPPYYYERQPLPLQKHSHHVIDKPRDRVVQLATRRNGNQNQAPPNILLKSSWPFAEPAVALAEAAPDPPPTADVADTVVVVRVFLLPKPARGRDTAVRGMNNPPGVLVLADEPDPDVPARGAGGAFSKLSSDSWSVFSLNIIGSARSSSLPASCYNGQQKREHWKHEKRTAGFSSSAIASFVSWNTSTRCTLACLLRTCCKSPSCVPEGSPRTRTERLLTSADRLPVGLQNGRCVRLHKMNRVIKDILTGSLRLSRVYLPT